MMKKYVIPIFLCTIISSIQADVGDIQEQILQIELAERARLGIIDDVISFAAGCSSVLVTGVAAACLSRCVTHNVFKNYLALLGGFALHGMVSAKLANDEGQKKKMFGRGGIVGATALFFMFLPGAFEVYLDTYYGSK